MRTVVVTAVLLLVVLMSIVDPSAGSLHRDCRDYVLAYPCRKNIPNGPWYQLDNGRCLKIFSKAETFDQAEKNCNSAKYLWNIGHLVSVHSDEEKRKLVCYMYRHTSQKLHYWIGLRKGGQSYTWTDNKRYDYTNWHSGQPDFYDKNEYCAEMNYGDWGLWNDLSCSTPRPYVCTVYLF